ncbi:hypothetical protein [Achromobacter phage Motura]|uniref:Uncharacterized protein n=1 Tax=Achromobacter phage Motura TaxID=2591403 RepID=A0A514CSR9_9CAUD|nr:hypothetical protein H1O15_gp292 [Achromobacter phage Motura]QDH83514.1 hypothetical protein [Achromobacter phage Motura]
MMSGIRVLIALIVFTVLCNIGFAVWLVNYTPTPEDTAPKTVRCHPLKHCGR